MKIGDHVKFVGPIGHESWSMQPTTAFGDFTGVVVGIQKVTKKSSPDFGKTHVTVKWDVNMAGSHCDLGCAPQEMFELL